MQFRLLSRCLWRIQPCIRSPKRREEACFTPPEKEWFIAETCHETAHALMLDCRKPCWSLSYSIRILNYSSFIDQSSVFTRRLATCYLQVQTSKNKTKTTTHKILAGAQAWRSRINSTVFVAPLFPAELSSNLRSRQRRQRRAEIWTYHARAARAFTNKEETTIETTIVEWREEL